MRLRSNAKLRKRNFGRPIGFPIRKRFSAGFSVRAGLERVSGWIEYSLTRIYSVEYIKRVESVFEIIAEPNRRAILSLLVSSEQSVERSGGSFACRSRPYRSTCGCCAGRIRRSHGRRTAPTLPTEAGSASGGGCLAGAVPRVLVRARGCSPSATSTAWSNPHQRKGSEGELDDRSRAVRTGASQRGAGPKGRREVDARSR